MLSQANGRSSKTTRLRLALTSTVCTDGPAECVQILLRPRSRPLAHLSPKLCQQCWLTAGQVTSTATHRHLVDLTGIALWIYFLLTCGMWTGEDSVGESCCGDCCRWRSEVRVSGTTVGCRRCAVTVMVGWEEVGIPDKKKNQTVFTGLLISINKTGFLIYTTQQKIRQQLSHQI